MTPYEKRIFTYLLKAFRPELLQVGRVFYEDGRRKYVEDCKPDTSWMTRGAEHHESKRRRHEAKRILGEQTDPDSLQDHRAHEVLRAMMAWRNERRTK